VSLKILVKAGDSIEKDQGLITLETDKATMDVPAPEAGTVKEMKIKQGDKVSEGTVILTMEVGEQAIPQRPVESQPAAAAATKSPSPPAAPPKLGGQEKICRFSWNASKSRLGPGIAAERDAGTVPVVAEYSGKADLECEVLVLGSGPGGYTAAFRAADLGKHVVW